MFSRPLTSPWRRAFLWSTLPGGRADLEEKLRIDNTAILLEMGYFLKYMAGSCG
jgi:hypothetical protein